MLRYAMVIDTRTCIGCGDCVVACKTENNIPAGLNRDWIVEAIRDGDVIEIDVPGRRLDVRLSPEDIERRLKESLPPSREVTPLLLSFRERYQSLNCYGKKGA